MIETSWTYKFQFITGFETLNDIYTVAAIMSFEEMLALNINLVQTLYTKVGKTQLDYEQDVQVYKGKKVYKLVLVGKKVNPKDPVIYYIPEVLIDKIPDYNVKQYPDLVVALRLGAIDNAETIGYIKTVLQQQISKMFGITVTPDVISVDKIWMTTDDYAALEATRNTAMKEVVNWYSETVRLQGEIDKLKALIAAQQETIMAFVEGTATGGTGCTMDPNAVMDGDTMVAFGIDAEELLSIVEPDTSHTTT